jgi:branched-chain amino acid transport system permease protein
MPRGTTFAGATGPVATVRALLDSPAGSRAGAFLPVAAILAVQLVVFPLPLGQWVLGLIIGGLTALIALGMALTYQSNRVVSFAQADLGMVPVVLTYLLITAWGWPWLLAVPTGLVAAVVLGAVVEMAIIRRFRNAPRLLLTVATLGLAQILAGLTVLLQVWFDTRLLGDRIEPPFELQFTLGGRNFFTYDVLAVIAVPIAVGALALVLRRSDVGLAARAIADRGERAGMLGVPIGRIQTLIWATTAVLAFVAIFLRSGVLGLPVVTAFSLGILLRALAALLIGRFTDLPVVAAAAVALGVLERAVDTHTELAVFGWVLAGDVPVEPVLAAVIIAALLLRRRASGRDASEISSWRTSEDIRPVPAALARLTPVRLARVGGALAVLAVVLVLPHLLTVDRSLRASALIVYAILGCSVVVLTGWTGLVSLGQVALFALGAALGATITSSWNLDLTLALLLSALAGAAAAVVVGFPALRLRGIELGVVTLAAALAATEWLLNPRFFDWVPTGRVERPALFGRVDIDSPTRMYVLILVVLVLVLLALKGIRNSRTGRALLALRDNERGAQAYGLSAVRLRLTAFALSGAIAGLAGCLFAHHQQAFGQQPYLPGENLLVFTMVVLGGVATPLGAVLGAVWLMGTRWFLPSEWQLLASGAGVLLVLLILPGGFGGLVLQLRDRWLIRLAGARGLDVGGFTAAHLDPDTEGHAEAAVHAAELAEPGSRVTVPSEAPPGEPADSGGEQ